LKTERKIYRRN